VARRRDPEAIEELVGFLESAWAEHFEANHLMEKI